MKMPEHVAVIMDGNGRWASRRGLPRVAGHRAGARAARQVVTAAGKAGVSTLTLFAFSSENWHRPSSEVRVLLDLLRRTIRNELDELHANDTRIVFIGDRSRFSSGLADEMANAERRTATNRGLTLVIAVDYGGRWDIVRRARELAAACRRGELAPDDIDEACFNDGLCLGALGAPDLCIRTGGERRVSNFLLWQLAYSELYFTDILWPDFGDRDLHDALEWFGGRERRFGHVASPLAAR